MKIYTLIFINLIISISLFAQVEMVPPEHGVYLFLKRMQLEGKIEGYNSSNIPVSRAEIADYLKVLNEAKMSSTDKKLFEDFLIEFSYDINKNLKNPSLKIKMVKSLKKFLRAVKKIILSSN